ncbi:unnamed protein product [Auanema sp. JU1783]|nr:unnamed protein product [Auanema sp. JU1783]
MFERLGLLLLTCTVESRMKEEKQHALENKIKDVAMTPKEVKKMEQLHYGWYIQAVSALIGAMGKEMYDTMDRPNKKAFVACMNKIEREYDLQMGADCLVKAFDGLLVSSYPDAVHSPQFDFVDKDISSFEPSVLQEKRKRRKSLFANGNRPVRLSYRHRFKRNILSLYANDEMRAEAKRIDKVETSHGYKVKTMDHMPSLLTNRKSPVKTVTKLIGTVVGSYRNKTLTDGQQLKHSYQRIKDLQSIVEKKNMDGQFKHRMLDMVIGKNNPLRARKSFTERFRDIMPDMPNLEDEKLYGLVDSVSKHTKDVNYNMLSPRFLSIMPDRYQTKKKLLSPNMFPLYKDDSENSVLPIPNILESTGMDQGDQDSVMELVMDVSGVNDAVDTAIKTVQGLKSVNLDKDILDITNLLDTTFKTLESTLHDHQKEHLNTKKYSFLEKDQLESLFGEKALLNRTNDFPFDIERYGEMSFAEKEEGLRNTIRLIAKGKLGDSQNALHPTRGKRAVVHFQHVSLSPYAFSPSIHTLSVLGPVTLSPSLFSPSILSPLLLSPPVLSPQVGNPLIFSPYVLGPNVLSAAVFNAYVFSPYVLAPNVINPYVLSPLILSPFVLCPDVVSPTILSGVVLSPSVLSPSVFTDSALAVNVLSPTFLS